MKTSYFQRFEQSSSPKKGPERLAALRAEMKKEQLDGFLVPRSDMFQGEYVARRDERLGWLCLLYTSPSPRDVEESRMPSSA